jgi:hypothetical protein
VEFVLERAARAVHSVAESKPECFVLRKISVWVEKIAFLWTISLMPLD